MHYDFKIETSRERLLKAIETMLMIEHPEGTTLDEMKAAEAILQSYKGKIQAIGMTLSLIKVDFEDAKCCLRKMEPEHVIVEIIQTNEGEDAFATQFGAIKTENR